MDMHKSSGVPYFLRTYMIWIMPVFVLFLLPPPTEVYGQKNASAAQETVKSRLPWLETKSSEKDEKIIDFGNIYAPKSQIYKKKTTDNHKTVEKRLQLLLDEKKQLEKILKQLNRKKQELRLKVRPRKKRRCA
ncbi:MAG: hypothetical protein DWQ10_14415 [Calditrichaeota bacterium]|nr:MAG: hypothetical protein DWQ10_14415 [Calditrichota bacterium]